MAELLIVAGMGAGQSFALKESPLTIGRHGSSQIQLWDTKASREHARIEKRSDGYYIVDLDSRNGTYVNGAPVKRSARLANGDRIKVADTVFVFSVEASISFMDARNTGFVTVVDASLRTQEAKIVDRTPPPGDEAALHSAQAAIEILQALAELTTSASDSNIVLEGAMDLAIELVGGDRGFISLGTGTSDSFVMKTSRPKASTPEEVPLSRTILDYAVRKEESVLSSDLMTDPRFGGQLSVKTHCIKSAIYVPLKARGQIIGILGVDTPSPGKRFTREHLRHLSVFGNHLAMVLQNLELRGAAEHRRVIEAQIRMAREIQASFLPSQSVPVMGLDYAAKMQPAMDVGGDFYDWRLLEAGRIAFAVGDVAGKGVPAALSMARIMGCMRGLTAALQSPREVLNALNRSLVDCGTRGIFTTMVFAVFDPRTRVLELSVAGHPSPLVFAGPRRSSAPIRGNWGLPLGILQDMEWPSVTVKLNPHDLVVFYTDGIIESESKTATARLQSLRELVEGLADLPCIQIIEGIFENMTSDDARRDDATLLVLRAV